MDIKELEKKYEELGKEIEKLKNEDELPKHWEDLEIISGVYIDNFSNTRYITGSVTSPTNRCILKTEAQAKASVALAQLSQLMAVYNDGWEPDWNNQYDLKYAISYRDNKITVSTVHSSQKFLVFETAKLRDKFLENFRDLIEEAKPLL